ncbi:MAG: MBL fold metallo-hydrolase [Firmicutes bacterium]|nr:MBL fold metallo-hydrolase [Bacillota bacterium]
MNLRFCSIASGSSGNCYLVRTDETVLLVDAGLSCKKIEEGLTAAGTKAENIDAILVTHEHIDHVRGIKPLTNKCPDIEIYCSEGTWKHISQETKSHHNTVSAGKEFWIGDIRICPFKLSHDAEEPIGYSFESEGRVLTILTDSGYVTEEAHEYLVDSNLIVLESNHDIDTLQVCSYPYELKRRIMSEFGHISNETAGQELCRILKDGKWGLLEKPTVLLAHLSKETNFPEMAETTVKGVMESEGYYVGRHLDMHTLARDQFSDVYSV